MNDSTAAPLPTGLNARLSFMMFLQYAIWGAWLPILYPFLTGHRAFTLEQFGWIMSGSAVGAIIGPFLAGQIADRYFNTEKFLGISHLIGAGLVYKLSTTTEFKTFLALSVVYGLVYAPTLALTNSLSFAHLPDRDRDFGRVRLWGTIGWIAAGIAVGQWLLLKHTPVDVTAKAIEAAQDAGRADAFRLSALLGVFMGLYCFTLPNTPPSEGAKEQSATAEALGEIRRQPLLTLFLIAVPVSCIHQFYFVYTSQFLSGYGQDAANTINKIFGVGGGGLMTIGQMSELLVLAIIPFLAKSLSRKSLLAIGLLAYGVRMALFAYTDSLATVLLGVALYGLCFGCFIFVAFMVVDEETTPDVRATAQNLFNLVIIGVGIILGSWIATWVGAWATPENEAMDYTKLFSVPMYASLACLAILLAFYPSRSPRRGDLPSAAS
ncbi:Putative nucleoside transporter YegT [Planctomycetes bacterium Poly30]|uniref:Nucleoside transporter YegT n=1 Tax=Saltatorellus ferox TaxID=2528018 RepID=A0A518EU44_9BACT|nr:Putative nucleoside transporter YegT [Planctomycetes bacterium Poly30]